MDGYGGKRVIFSSAVMIATVGHPICPDMREYMYTAPVTIEDNSRIYYTIEVYCNEVKNIMQYTFFALKIDGFSLVNISKNNDLAWDMIHIGQADVNIMECG